jgi:hypothetical protein
MTLGDGGIVGDNIQTGSHLGLKCAAWACGLLGWAAFRLTERPDSAEITVKDRESKAGSEKKAKD